MTESDINAVLRALGGQNAVIAPSKTFGEPCPAFHDLTFRNAPKLDSKVLEHVMTCRRCRIIIRTATGFSASELGRWCSTLIARRELNLLEAESSQDPASFNQSRASPSPWSAPRQPADYEVVLASSVISLVIALLRASPQPTNHNPAKNLLKPLRGQRE
jgi:hypothetical protein